MEKHGPYFNLLDALKETGCPVCFLVKKSIHKSMDDFLYESVNDSGVRQDIKASQGFCNRHAWQLQKFGDGFGHAIIYSDLMNIILKKFKEVDESMSVKELLKIISPGDTVKQICIFCSQEKDIEERYISIFWENFSDPEFSISYKNSFGLCLPHIVLALSAAKRRDLAFGGKKCKDKRFRKEFIEIETPKLSNLLGELKEFMRKHDYRFSKEKFETEGDSWISAIEKMIGKEGIY